jgi:hypothetical protein
MPNWLKYSLYAVVFGSCVFLVTKPSRDYIDNKVAECVQRRGSYDTACQCFERDLRLDQPSFWSVLTEENMSGRLARMSLTAGVRCGVYG